MSDRANLDLFQERASRVAAAHKVQKHQRMVSLGHLERAPGARLPYGKLLLVLGMCLVLKALAIATLSEGTYRTHVMYLQTGSTVERLIGAALQPDRVSLALARHLSI
jgi:hypothetical protein